MRIIKLKEVMSMTGLGRSTLYKLQAEGLFPQSVEISERAVGWVMSEVQDWIQSRIDSRG